MTNKCKCRKDVMVVVIDSSTPYGGTFCDFLKELSPEKRCKYNYVPFYANTSTEAWVDKLKCKLQQLCKKNCKKPNVLSTLFDTNLEMLLARVQACVNYFLLTHSTDEVNRVFANYQLLPAGKLPGRSNLFYKNDGTYDTLVVDDLADDNYTASVNYNMAGDPVRVVTDLITPGAGKFVASYKNSFSDLGVTRDNVSNAFTLSDKPLAQLAGQNGGEVCMANIDENTYVYTKKSGAEDSYYKLYKTDDIGPEELASYAGLVPGPNCFPQCDPEDNCLQLNQAKSTGMELNQITDYP